MQKAERGAKKSKSRNLKGLSIFDDEIAAPADYGDFMKIDAPVALRTSNVVEAVPASIQAAPVWEKFIGYEGEGKVPVSVSVLGELSGSGTGTGITQVQVQVQEQVQENAIGELNSVPVSVSGPVSGGEEALQVHAPVSGKQEEEAKASAEEEEFAHCFELIDALPKWVGAEETSLILKDVKLDHPIAQSFEAEVSPPTPSRVDADRLAINKAQPETVHKLYTHTPSLKNKSEITQLGPKPVTVYDKLVSNIGFGSLVGVQRRIVLFLFEDCVRNGGSETTPISTEHMVHTLEVPYNTVRGSLVRLKEKDFIEPVMSKEGRGGWTIFRLNRNIYSELLLMKNSSGQILKNDIGIGPISSSLPTDSKEALTSTANDEKSLNPEWAKIDFSAIEAFGFSKYHLKQVETQNKLTATEMQDSINFFAFDLNKNNKKVEIKGEPLNFFMGIVKKGIPYMPPANYISPEDEAKREYLKFIEKRAEEKKLNEEKIKDIAFNEWKQTGDTRPAIESMPDFMRDSKGPMLDAYLKEYFQNAVWESVKEKYSAQGVGAVAGAQG